MSHFYSVISGQGGPATRCGSKGSGVVATAASWRGAVSVRMYVDDAGVDRFVVSQERWHGAGVSRDIARGVVGGEFEPIPNKELMP